MRFATEETYDDHCFDFYDEVGDDIGSGYVCFDFRSTNVVQLSNPKYVVYAPKDHRRQPVTECQYPLITYLT